MKGLVFIGAGIVMILMGWKRTQWKHETAGWTPMGLYRTNSWNYTFLHAWIVLLYRVLRALVLCYNSNRTQPLTWNVKGNVSNSYGTVDRTFIGIGTSQQYSYPATYDLGNDILRVIYILSCLQVGTWSLTITVYYMPMEAWYFPISLMHMDPLLTYETTGQVISIAPFTASFKLMAKTYCTIIETWIYGILRGKTSWTYLFNRVYKVSRCSLVGFRGRDMHFGYFSPD